MPKGRPPAVGTDLLVATILREKERIVKDSNVVPETHTVWKEIFSKKIYDQFKNSYINSENNSGKFQGINPPLIFYTRNLCQQILYYILYVYILRKF